MLINERYTYRDGRIFPYHLLINANNGAARDSLINAEIWHIHNYLSPHLAILRRAQKVVAQFHSVPRLGNWKELMKFATASYTISQPLQQKEYGLKALPNLIDPDEYRPIRRDKKVRIAFAPSSRAPIGHLASKGYYQVKRVLDDVAFERDVEIVWIEGLPYQENLRLKQTSHILVDDVVTGNWHRTSLEGACFGCAIINKVVKTPFVQASLNTLKQKLLWLIDSPATLSDIQERTRLWVLQYEHAADNVGRYLKAYQEALK